MTGVMGGVMMTVPLFFYIRKTKGFFLIYKYLAAAYSLVLSNRINRQQKTKLILAQAFPFVVYNMTLLDKICLVFFFLKTKYYHFT